MEFTLFGIEAGKGVFEINFFEITFGKWFVYRSLFRIGIWKSFIDVDILFFKFII